MSGCDKAAEERLGRLFIETRSSDVLAALEGYRAEAAEREAQAQRERADRLEAALRRLRAETHGLVTIERVALTALVGNTNMRCVEEAVEQAEAALAAQPAHPFLACPFDERTSGHNFTCALLCVTCGLPAEKHVFAQPAQEVKP